jgi:hypothetical protein
LVGSVDGSVTGSVVGSDVVAVSSVAVVSTEEVSSVLSTAKAVVNDEKTKETVINNAKNLDNLLFFIAHLTKIYATIILH